MEQIANLKLDFLDALITPFNDEIEALTSGTKQSTCLSVDENFYRSLENHDESGASFNTNLIKQNQDFVFDKKHVNPFFVSDNTAAALLDTINFEDTGDVRQEFDDNDADEDHFTEARKKMHMFLGQQRSQRREAKMKKIKSAIEDYRWLYQPKLISSFPKTFLQECVVAEYLLDNFVKTVHESGTELRPEPSNLADCIFGMSLEDFLGDKRKQHYFNKLFLPSVFKFPKQLNTVYVFNKYIAIFFPNNVTIAQGRDTLHSLFLNTAKFKNLSRTQTVASFVRSWSNITQASDDDADVIANTIRRLKLIQYLTVFYMIMKSRHPCLKMKRVDRGIVSSITNDFIMKANTLYFHERLNLWSCYFQNEAKPKYSYNVIDLFHYVINKAIE